MDNSIQDTAYQDSPLQPRIRRRRLGLMLALVVIVFAGMVYFFAPLAQTFAADRVLNRDELRTATIERGDLMREVMAQGRVVVANSPTLFSAEPGYVDLNVKAGDPVAKGQVLALVSSPELKELLARERAQLTQLQVDLERQKIASKQRRMEQQQSLDMANVQLKAMLREKRRADRSYALNLISELDYEEIADDLARAQLVHRQANESLALLDESMAFYDQSLKLQSDSQRLVIQALERRVEQLSVTSPVDGMVGNLEVNQKQAVTANQPLISVVDLTAFEIEAEVPEGLAGELAPMMEASVRLNAHDYTGVVTAISPEVVRGQVAVRIRFVGELPPQLRQNQRLTARILLENRPAVLRVERGPYFERFPGYVLKLDGDRAYKVPVVLGGKSLRHVEIIEGLDEGDTVIVSAVEINSTDKDILITH